MEVEIKNARILHEWACKDERYAFFICEKRPGEAPHEFLSRLAGLAPADQQPAEHESAYGVSRWVEDPFGNGYWAPCSDAQLSFAVFKEFERLLQERAF